MVEAGSIPWPESFAPAAAALGNYGAGEKIAGPLKAQADVRNFAKFQSTIEHIGGDAARSSAVSGLKVEATSRLRPNPAGHPNSPQPTAFEAAAGARRRDADIRPGDDPAR